ncbi:alpha/beta hydrolase [Fimbriimonas ginsengisoli]|uniref:Alpha/beta hydrolase n=1 Tax=Fimbriimonas ginsengisoli Gsoil 348 TaxID=661478 RepID=A0A068NZ20_FIMGI|nr:alpha/beta hydrolase [Fimbriimonas ginsengisoli]AIE87809.1 alpha/beta hydrolase [Fimbriimonas ginsengisoli Gsoil 348]
MRTIRLWEGDAPGAVGHEELDIPTLTVLSEQAGESKPAFIVFPGGAYAMLADHEGLPVAKWFETVGVRGFVLRYRLGPRYHHPIELGDAARAVRLVRSRAAEFGVDPKKIGVLGFSAGGHLASTISTHHDSGSDSASDPIDRASSRPDAATLIYPVISMTAPFGHMYSREMLLGKNSTDQQAEALSNYKTVSLDTPPTFLCHGANDDAVPVQNSLLYSQALADHKVPFELHVPKHGPHGFGMGAAGSPQDWRPAAEKWLRGIGF